MKQNISMELAAYSFPYIYQKDDPKMINKCLNNFPLIVQVRCQELSLLWDKFEASSINKQAVADMSQDVLGCHRKIIGKPSETLP